MKRILSIALSGALCFSLAACGGSSSSTAASSAAETLTGTAKGFGGDVTATLTVENGTITACTLTGDSETPDIGGAALEELQKQVVDANGYEIDGVSGATVTSDAVRKAVASAMGEEIAEEPAASSEAASSEAAEPAENVQIEGGLQIGQSYTAAHGDKCFTYAVAVVQDDVIVAAYLDEFQFMSAADGVTGVPNSDSDFGASYAEGKVLGSKRENAAYYSENMASAGSTVAIDANFDAIQNYAVGKTIDELTTAAGDENAVDLVSGATLVDTAGYLNAIAEAARNAQENQAVEFTGESDQLTLNVAYGAAHGTKCFTLASALTDGENIVLSYIDDLQFMSSDDGVVGVPNSDGGFGANVAEGKVLASKRVNNDYYSTNMAAAGSTVSIAANFDAIQNHINGMSIADTEALAGEENPVDAISGATLVDTAGYLNTVLAAAQG